MRDLSKFKGCLIGGAVGDALGFDAIPQKYLDKLELRDVISEIAENLYNDCRISKYGMGDDIWESKYISMTYKREDNAVV